MDIVALFSSEAGRDKCPVCEAVVARSQQSRCSQCPACHTVLWMPSWRFVEERISAVHKCPECKADVVRQDFDQHGFCRGNCNILLFIPSWREPQRPIEPVYCQVGENPQEKITRERYELLSRAVSIAAAG